MIRTRNFRSSTSLEVALAGIVLFTLPLFEAVKNLGSVSLILLWITGILLTNIIYGGFSINNAFTVKIIAAAFLLIVSFVVNIHVYNSSKSNQPPNKSIMKIASMMGRGLILIILIGAAVAFI